MKPIAVFQHTEVGAPGSVISILESLGKRCRVIRIVDGEPVPENADEFGGMVFMGGYMGVHDPLPWIPQELALIRQADALDIPVAGHCLGSQLLALALGGCVRANHRREIGWQQIVTEDGALAEEWWGQPSGTALLTFQWHGDTFEPPAGAVRIATSPYCANQAFVVRGLHLGMQSHFEMTPELVTLSLQRNGAQLEREYAQGNPAVTSMQETQREVPARTAQMRTALERLYKRWVKGCK
ncbi:type 1 glutamine amidotransferase [Noviherbaspirillum cavernae]|uniref:Type 1 glutamine amidotransferase n=1 Tax=Noviherbaspirillum cavernae TaxID=2320862 RepID=A0A418WX07_9BURK|nr:type 1 glutamine amidotransferase [Noviherbaspirillum cavernae]RJG04770.1 type 1 glutamine amidotransferase [Noviherbaspirillum cavernae]